MAQTRRLLAQKLACRHRGNTYPDIVDRDVVVWLSCRIPTFRCDCLVINLFSQTPPTPTPRSILQYTTTVQPISTQFSEFTPLNETRSQAAFSLLFATFDMGRSFLP